MRKTKLDKKRFKDLLNSEGESDDASVSGDEPEDNLVASTDNVIALDCEMVGVGKYKHNALARCSIVDYHGKVIYDRYIKPSDVITDFRTRWSGILPHHMDKAVPFKVARKEILSVIKNKIIIGHSLHFDLKILKLRRSPGQIRDTSKNISLRKIADFPPNETPSLRRLSLAILDREIQSRTHCSVEDSIAAMDLYRTVEVEWEKQFNKSSKYLSDVFWPKWLEGKVSEKI